MRKVFDVKPLVIDLYCGLGGWSESFIEQGYDAIGFDIERHEYGDHRYPGQLVIQDVLTLHGSQFKDATVIVASPPCQTYSWMAMPWTIAKAKAAEIRADETGAKLEELNRLFNACFRIQKEACEAAGHHIPMIVENVRGAQPYVGRAKYRYGSFYFWGDIPALMPTARVFKSSDGRKGQGSGSSWFYQNGGNARSASSSSLERKMWSATIAKIPAPLATHIAKVYYPGSP
jgi:C-5 cytosine-specific DNA methylase